MGTTAGRQVLSRKFMPAALLRAAQLSASTALFLALALAGACHVASAEGTVHAYSWSPVPAECRHITPMVWVKKDSDPAEIARLSLKRPGGCRALFS